MKEEYRAKAEGFMDYLLGLPTTSGGLVWIGSSEWGSLRYAGNFAMFAMQVTSHIKLCHKFYHDQIFIPRLDSSASSPSSRSSLPSSR